MDIIDLIVDYLSGFGGLLLASTEDTLYLFSRDDMNEKTVPSISINKADWMGHFGVLSCAHLIDDTRELPSFLFLFRVFLCVTVATPCD
jgi:hypothetical protein